VLTAKLCVRNLQPTGILYGDEADNGDLRNQFTKYYKDVLQANVIGSDKKQHKDLI